MPKATRQGREEQRLEFVWLVVFLLPLRVRVPRGVLRNQGPPGQQRELHLIGTKGEMVPSYWDTWEH